MNSNNNIKNKLSENNLKILNRNPYSFNSSDHINRISSSHRIHNASQKDFSSSSNNNTPNHININSNNLNKSIKNSETSPIITNILYNKSPNSNNNSNSNINLNENKNISKNNSNNNNNINNTFKKSTHESAFIQPKPAYEFYGYAFYLVSFLAMFIWLIWAFFSKSETQDSIFEKIGFTYYPNRYWAIAIPDYIVISILFYVVIFLCYNFIHTPSFDSLNTVTDKSSNLMKNINYSRLEDDDDIPELQDIPISIVNAYLYSDSFNTPNEPYSTYSPS